MHNYPNRIQPSAPNIISGTSHDLATANSILAQNIRDLQTHLRDTNKKPPYDYQDAGQTPSTARLVTQYCWTHGLSVGYNHISATCNNPTRGHQKTATGSNTQGSSTYLAPPKRSHPSQPPS